MYPDVYSQEKQDPVLMWFTVGGTGPLTIVVKWADRVACGGNIS